MISFINSVPGSTADQQKVTDLQDDPLSKLTYVDVEKTPSFYRGHYIFPIQILHYDRAWNVHSIVGNDLKKK